MLEQNKIFFIIIFSNLKLIVSNSVFMKINFLSLKSWKIIKVIKVIFIFLNLFKYLSYFNQSSFNITWKYFSSICISIPNFILWSPFLFIFVSSLLRNHKAYFYLKSNITIFKTRKLNQFYREKANIKVICPF